MTRVVGIDGGGTRTRCLIADGDGAVLGQGQAGPATRGQVRRKARTQRPDP